MSWFYAESAFGLLVRRFNKSALRHSYEQPEYYENFIANYEKDKNYSVPKKNEADSQSVEIGLNSLEDDGLIYVTWDGDDDKENPRNWPLIPKLFFCIQVSFLTLAVYLASAIYTPGIHEIQQAFNVSYIVAILPLTLFVFGYGFGPMIFSPFSEIPECGRMPIYIVSLFISVILHIPLALSKNIAGFCILRFLTGFFASPCLSIGPAAVCDTLSVAYGPIGIGLWSIAAVSGPSFGPLFGAVLTVKGGWRWTFWFLCILDGISLLAAIFFFPEPNEVTLLHRKAKRLRKLTGNMRITSKGEQDTKHMDLSKKLVDTLWRPIEISLKEPVIIMINLYLSLVYAIMYLWFECFPIVFQETKHFTMVLLGVSYLSVIVGSLTGSCIYIYLAYKNYTLRTLAGETVYPEVFIPMTIGSGVAMTVGLFVFGWTASPDIHWILPLIGAGIFSVGAFITFQALFNYIGMSFWRFVASAFAGNALFRSFIGGALPLVGRSMFVNLGSEKFPVGWGCTIMGFLCAAMTGIPILFYLRGPKLRARSKYAGTD